MMKSKSLLAASLALLFIPISVAWAVTVEFKCNSGCDMSKTTPSGKFYLPNHDRTSVIEFTNQKHANTVPAELTLMADDNVRVEYEPRDAFVNPDQLPSQLINGETYIIKCSNCNQAKVIINPGKELASGPIVTTLPKYELDCLNGTIFQDNVYMARYEESDSTKLVAMLGPYYCFDTKFSESSASYNWNFVAGDKISCTACKAPFVEPPVCNSVCD